MITIAINAQLHTLDDPMSLLDLLQKELRIQSLEHLAVAHNGEVVRREAYEGITVQDGDFLDLVEPVGGG